MPFDVNGNILTTLQIKEFNEKPKYVKSGILMDLNAGFLGSYPGSGTAWYDLSNSGNNGTLTNGPTYSSANGGTIVFDGTNDYVDCGGGMNHGTGPFTYEAWANTDSITGGYGWIIGKAGYNMGLNRYNNVVQFFLYNSTGSLYAESVYILSIGTWWHMVGTFDGSTIRLYVNGSQYGSGQNIGTARGYGTTSLCLGGGMAGGLNFGGKISSAKVYNRALSADEVTINFNATRTRFGV